MDFLKNIFCPKIVPLVYDDSLSYYEYLNKMHNKINEIVNAMATMGIRIYNTHSTLNEYIYPSMIAANNCIYVTLKDVPKGVALSNATYWSKIVDMTSTYETLEDEIEALDDRIDTLTTTVGNMASTISSMGSTVSGHTTSINTLNSTVSAHATYISQREIKLKARNFLVCGDSFAFQPSAWCDIVKSNLNIVNDNWHKVAVSGAAFSNAFNNTFKSQIENYTGDKNAITHIIVVGGLNDSSSEAMANNGVENGINAFVTYAKTNYPNADIAVYYVGNALDDSSVISGRTVDYRLMAVWKYQTTLATNGVKFVNFHNVLATNASNFGSDRLHPSNYGGIAIGNAISNDILGCPQGLQYPLYNVELTAYNIGASVTSGLQSKIELDNTTFVLNTGTYWGAEITNGSSITPTATAFAKCNHFFNKEFKIKTFAQFGNFDSKQYQAIPVEVSFYHDCVYICSKDINSANTGYNTHTAGANASIYLFDSVMSFPTYFIN